MAELIRPDNQNSELVKLLKSSLPFSEFTEQEILLLLPHLIRHKLKPGEIVIQEGEPGTSAYVVESGEFCFEKMERPLKVFKPGAFFGEIALLDQQTRMGTVRSLSHGTLLILENRILEKNSPLPDSVLKKIFRGFAKLVTSYMREDSNLYDNMEVLLIQDGGCAPGYNSVTSFISEHLEKSGLKVFITAEGFKSLVRDKDEDYRCLIYHKSLYSQLEHVPGVIHSPPLRDARGADFRSERYREFKQTANQKKAAEAIKNRHVKIVVGIGGNGTFAGIKALSRHSPKKVKFYFIPVTIDSDISGTHCIGEYTGVEIGAEKIRCYMADARTHNRCYLIEMMGARGGYHALHSCLGAGAHLAVLPSSEFDIKQVAFSLSRRDYAVIVVAEGYKREHRQNINFKGNAAEFFKNELESTGTQFPFRLVCEPFSRDIRGASPNNSDIMLAQRMARRLTHLIADGKNKHMPAVLSGKEFSIPFDKITTDNSVKSELAGLANRLY